MKKKDLPSKPSSEFERVAREIGADETGEAFERAFGKIVPPKRPQKLPSKPKKTVDGKKK